MWRYALELGAENILKFLASKVEWGDGLETLFMRDPVTDREREFGMFLDWKEGYGLAADTDETCTTDGRLSVTLRTHISLTVGALRRALASRRRRVRTSASLESVLGGAGGHGEGERVRVLLVPRWVRVRRV
jgi:hypothetical protein